MLLGVLVICRLRVEVNPRHAIAHWASPVPTGEIHRHIIEEPDPPPAWPTAPGNRSTMLMKQRLMYRKADRDLNGHANR